MRLRALVAAVAALLFSGCTANSDVGDAGTTAASAALRLTSTSFANGTAIPAKHACDGGEVSPPLSIAGAPAGTRSLALLMEDLDVKTDGRALSHWVVWGIDPAAASFPEGGVPQGAVEGRNQVGKDGYLGPCPPKGAPAHHYRITAFALDAAPDLPATTTAKELEAAMQAHILGQATLEGTFARPA